MSDACADCRFWRQERTTFERQRNVGHCVRRAPILAAVWASLQLLDYDEGRNRAFWADYHVRRYPIGAKA